MSGGQGARQVGSQTPTTYESVAGGENRTRMDVRSAEDEGPIEIDKDQEKVDDPVARAGGGPTFGRPKEAPGRDEDSGITGTGE